MSQSKQFKSKVILIMAILFVIVSLHSQGFSASAHGDKRNLPKGCQSCHQGHGTYNTPMLPEQKSTFCFRCHGNDDNRHMMQVNGYLANNMILGDIGKVFQKPYHHPIEKTGIHKYGETLPEIDPSMPRHSECGDCHHHHYTTKTKPTLAIKGASQQGASIQEINFGIRAVF